MCVLLSAFVYICVDFYTENGVYEKINNISENYALQRL